MRLAVPALLLLLTAWSAAAQGDPPKGSIGITGRLEGRTDVGATSAASAGAGAASRTVPPLSPSVRAEVDATIRRAIDLQRAGKHDEAVAALRDIVRRTGNLDAKSRYFLASAHLARAKANAKADPRGAREDRARALHHLRALPELAARSRDPAAKEWGEQARARLQVRARGTPVLDQYAGGGENPGGYCAPTALRMVLRQEGLDDPGADAVALEGAAPYVGKGSDPHLLAARARELGLTNAALTKAGRVDDLIPQLEAGRSVMVAGEGTYGATLEDGSRKDRSYPGGHWLVAVGHEKDAKGNVSKVVLNDPDGGLRVTMTRAEFLEFFSPEGDGHAWMVRHGK